MGAIAIREATADDAGAVADLWTEAYVTLGVGGRADPYTEADFAASARRGRVLVADRGEAITLWSRPGQVEARRLYESAGYRRAPERDSIDRTGHERLAFRLELEPAARMAP